MQCITNLVQDSFTANTCNWDLYKVITPRNTKTHLMLLSGINQQCKDYIVNYSKVDAITSSTYKKYTYLLRCSSVACKDN